MSIVTKKFDANIGKVLHLVINSIYTNKEIFLRELISNASDACNKLRYHNIVNNTSTTQDHIYQIHVVVDSKEKTIIISDSGIGMDNNDLDNYLGTIAQSGVQKFQKLLTSSSSENPDLIGKFGVGFYSAFMVASKVEVLSKKVSQSFVYKWVSDGTNEYTLEKVNCDLEQGTKITLYIKDSCIEFLDNHRLHSIIKTYSSHINFPIKLYTKDGKFDIVNRIPALWLKDIKSISFVEYKNFYNHVSYQQDDPFLIIHNKAEGILEYVNLLFIPSTKPFDLFHPSIKTSIKLYVNRVMISEGDNNLVPSYLRFLRGVVDSSDLPLNISRETLQNNHVVEKIKRSITNKVLNKLLDKSIQEPKKYIVFFNTFGEVLKEGLCNNSVHEEKEKILQICRFHSSIVKDNLISLDDYINRMLAKQRFIYYFNGESIDALKQNPQLEGFSKRGIEVILLTDNVDNIWVNAIKHYKDKQFLSITTDNINLDEISKLSNVITNSNNNYITSLNTKLIAEIKKVLKNKVKDVIVSSKLIDSPACLSSPIGSMNLRMEKFLISQKQLKEKTLRIFEVNPEHIIWKNISSSIEDVDSSSILQIKFRADLINVIFSHTILLEGDNVDNPSDFVEKANNLLSLVTKYQY